jgi:hypothetical protein
MRDMPNDRHILRRLVVCAPLLSACFMLAIAGTQAQAQCSCFAQLKYRSVDVGVVPTGYNHSFWWFKTADPAPDGTVYVVEGGPSGSCPFNCGQLIDFVVVGNTGHYPQDNQLASSSFIAPMSTALCVQTGAMLDFANAWNGNNPPNYVIAGSPNSNTFAHNLATAGSLTPASPPNAIGW